MDLIELRVQAMSFALVGHPPAASVEQLIGRAHEIEQFIRYGVPTHSGTDATLEIKEVII